MIQVPHFRQEKAKTCVPAGVRMVLDYLGIKRTEDEVAQALGTTPLGTNVMNIELLPKELGLEVWTGDISLEGLKDFIDKGIPVIVVVETPSLPYCIRIRDGDIHSSLWDMMMRPYTSTMPCCLMSQRPFHGITF